jgi:hypothetical protein
MADFERGFAVDEVVTMLPGAPLKMWAYKTTLFAFFGAKALFVKTAHSLLSDVFCRGYGQIARPAKKRIFGCFDPFVRVHSAQQASKSHKIKEIRATDVSRQCNLAGKSSDMNEIRVTKMAHADVYGVEVIQYEQDADELCRFGKAA